MRKHAARHWLHAGLDLLPLILIPVFMIYSHRHTIDSGSIEVPVNRVVDFNQLNNFDVNGQVYDLDYSFENYKVSIIGTSNSNSSFALSTFGRPIINHKYLIKGGYYSQSCRFTNNNAVDVEISNYDIILYCIDDSYDNYWLITASMENVPINYVNYMPIYDLTQMFGVGNEPTIEQFNTWYPNDYYSYTLSHKELLKGYSTQTYNDTDIMSQFTYQLYNSVDKYFNMGNVFGMSNVYDWFNLNIFGGNASISIYIVWNIVLYEFVMDLLFLLYALFMWFIDVTKRLIEKPLDSIK